MNTFQGLVVRLIKTLNKNKIKYMFTGAIASSYYGIPRTTMDVDLIIAIAVPDTPRLITALKEAQIDAKENQFHLAQETGYPIVSMGDALTPFTVDVILLEGSLEKHPCTLLNEPTYLQTPEALVLAKLRMIKATLDPVKSAKDVNDITAILQHTQVDQAKIKRGAQLDNTLLLLNEIYPNLS